MLSTLDLIKRQMNNANIAAFSLQAMLFKRNWNYNSFRIWNERKTFGVVLKHPAYPIV